LAKPRKKWRRTFLFGKFSLGQRLNAKKFDQTTPRNLFVGYTHS
jgi:hypothetical protein